MSSRGRLKIAGFDGIAKAPPRYSRRPLSDFVPPGYRLTAEAESRIAALAQARNRHDRRMLYATYRRHPIDTFQLDASPLPRCVPQEVEV